MIKMTLTCACILILSACKQQTTRSEGSNWSDNRLSISQAYEAYLSKPSSFGRSFSTISSTSNTNLWQFSASKMRMNLQHKRPRVKKQINRFLKKPQFVKNSSYRARPYYHYVLKRVMQKGLPAEMALLPFIESGYNPMATSTASAVGPWQFIESTGIQFGLKNTPWYDSRRDILASTEAATSLLKQLHKEFKGDWLLALAAYNCGSQCVRNAIKKNLKQGKNTDFWSLALPSETRQYVPKFLAIATVIKNAERLSIKLAPLQNQRYFSIIKFNGKVDLHQLADQTGLTTEQLFKLNAGYKVKNTNPAGTHRLIIPVEKATIFKQSLAKLVLNDQV